MGLADMRILLFVSPSTATRTALLVGMESLRSNSVLLELSFHLDTDGPDEAPQLSSYCGHNLWLVLPSPAIPCRLTEPMAFPVMRGDGQATPLAILAGFFKRWRPR